MELFWFRPDGRSSHTAKIRQRKQRAEMGDSKGHQSASMGHASTSLGHEIDGLGEQSVGKLKAKYLAVFGQESRSNHKQFLVRRIAWRLQANAQGDLTQRARERALALAEEADLRIRAPESFLKELSRGQRRGDPRLPAPGTWLTRNFRGQRVAVEVLDKGFRYQDHVYKSLSAVARQVTGTQWNGFLFFALNGSPERQRG